MKTLEFEYHYKIEFDNEVDQHSVSISLYSSLMELTKKSYDIHYETHHQQK